MATGTVRLIHFPPGSWVNSKSLGMVDWTPAFAQQDRSTLAQRSALQGANRPLEIRVYNYPFRAPRHRSE